MCPVARAKGIIDKKIRQPGEFAGKTRIVLLFARVKPQVLQKDEFPVLHFRYGLPDPGSNRLREGFDRSLQELRQAPGHRCQSQVLVHPAMRPAKVRAEDDPGPVIDQPGDRGKACPDPGVVFDSPVPVHGHIEIDPHEHPFPVNFHIPYRLFLHGSAPFFS